VVALIGIPMGLTSNPTQTAIYLQAPASEIGVAAGLQRTFGYFGAIGAVSLLGLMFGTHVTDKGFHNLALVMTAASALLLVFILLDRTLPRGAVESNVKHQLKSTQGELIHATDTTGPQTRSDRD
jgi:hypothetical protein